MLKEHGNVYTFLLFFYNFIFKKGVGERDKMWYYKEKKGDGVFSTIPTKIRGA